MFKVAQVSLESDLSAFSEWLYSQGLVHRIVEEQGEQVIFIEDSHLEAQVQQILQRYLTEPDFKLHLDLQPKKRLLTPHFEAMYPRAKPAQAPFIFIFMAISVVVALLTDFGQGGPILRAFLILDPLSLDVDLGSIDGRIQGLLVMLGRGELWRLISPDFIHFNVMHITFNLLMLWVLGGQLEIQKGSFSFFVLSVFVSIISNIAQLLDTGYLFGGLSGVVYGLVGYCWLLKRVEPRIFFPDILMKFSLVWLLMGYTPITEWLGWGRMANAAHLYGLLAGVVWAGITIAMSKPRKSSGR